MECYNSERLLDTGIDVVFVQDNISTSHKAGTIRGLHFQSPPCTQEKLVQCISGAIFDVVVDIRLGSPNFGKWQGFNLSDNNGIQLFVPAGFAHGFMTLIDKTQVLYKCTSHYKPSSEGSIRWNDPDLMIEWPNHHDIVISEKDSEAPFLRDFKSPFLWKRV